MIQKNVKPEALVQRLWAYCNILRDDGLSYNDYVEQLTYLLFLKMADERSKPPFLDLPALTGSFNWRGLMAKNDEEQLAHYQKILRRLGAKKDLFGSIYKNALSKFRDPAKFQLVAKEIDSIEWGLYESDVKGDAYEGLLERTASEGKAGAGQYFTARPLVDAISQVMNLTPSDTVCDPAAGTGGFLLAAHREMRSKAKTKAQIKHIAEKGIQGVELVESVSRLCLMNLVLHGIGGIESPVTVADALETKMPERFSVVMANPPFGKKSSITIVNELGEGTKENRIVTREDFWASTSNKQLNFLQHIFTILEQDGRAAVVLPDNVLFEGGAGESIRRELLKQTEVHTLLRLPAGIFYAQGVKANVLFFNRKAVREEPWTKELWIYDLRTNKHFTLKESTLKRSDLDDFVACYNPEDRWMRKERERFRCFTYDDLVKRDKLNLDIFWLKDDALEDSVDLPAPDVISANIVIDLEAALEQFATIAEDLK
jgi:type I restriction enzyme M protein